MLNLPALIETTISSEEKVRVIILEAQIRKCTTEKEILKCSNLGNLTS